jgi:hypothetical protein
MDNKSDPGVSAAEPPFSENERMEQKLREKGYDFSAQYAALNRGDYPAVEAFLASLAGPPRAEIQKLEQRINKSLGRTTPARPRTTSLRPMSARSTRPRERRRAGGRSRARAPAGRSDDSDPEPSLAATAARVCANPACGRDISSRRAQATRGSGKCREALRRLRRTPIVPEWEPEVVARVREHALDPLEALLWMTDPEGERDRFLNRRVAA